MNVKDSIKKVGAVAASTLMVGMTMGAAQSLSEFPGMFVDDEGSPTAQVVVGSQGAVSDVVGAVNVAAALGQATIQTSEMTEEVDVATEGSVGWSATGGQTLDTRNDQLYFGQPIDNVRDTLTGDHLDALQTVEFQDDAGNSQDVDFYLRPESQNVQFGTSGDNNVDPFLHVQNPADPSSTQDGLYELQANFGEGLLVHDGDQDGDADGNEDVLGEEVEMFGKTFTISEDSFSSGNAGQLILFGSSEEYDLETGESTTFTLNGEEHTIEVRAVTDSSTAAFYVDGSLQEETEGNTVNVAGTDVRVDDVIQTSSDNSEGLVTFSIGSEEYVIDAGGDTVEDGDGNDIEGVYAEMSGSASNNDLASAEYTSQDTIEISSITFKVGSADSDEDDIQAGDSFQDPMFDEINFRFGGLAPDAAEGASENVGEIEYGTADDNTADVAFMDGDNDATVEWLYDSSLGNGLSTDGELADADGDRIVVREGAPVDEDQYVVVDAGDFPHMFEVTSIDRDETSDITADDEATIDLRDVVTGQTVEVDLDPVDGGGDSDFGDGDTDHYAGSEVIDGQTYYFELEGESDTEIESGVQDGESTSQVADFRMAWDSGVSESDVTDQDTAINTGSQTSVYAPLDTDSGASVAFIDDVTLDTGLTTSVVGTANTEDYTVQVPSTESSSSKTLTIDLYANSGSSQSDTSGDGDINLEVVDGADSLQDATGSATVDGQEVTYAASFDSASSTLTFGLYDDSGSSGFQNSGGTASVWTEPVSVTMEPEDDNDEEMSYVVLPGTDTGDNEVEVSGEDSGSVAYPSTASSVQNLDSDDDLYTTYDQWGTHTVDDQSGQGTFTLHVPDQQATVGTAFTGAAGSLDMGGSSGTSSGEVTYTGVTNEDIRGALPDLAKTDEQVTSSDRQNSHLILVGGPAVNTLVADLADDGETWTADQWRNEHVDEALLQVVEDAFADGQHAMIVAGHSADDTRAAARYISEWRSHQDTLADAGMQYSPSSQEAPR